MFEASVDGQPYDPDRWANYYKPYGLNVPEGAAKAEDAPAAQARTAAPAPTAHEDDAPFDTDDTPAPTAPVVTAKPSSQKAEDILAMIRNRNKQ